MAAPSVGFNIFSGTNGDFAAAQLSYTTDTDVVTVPGSPPTPTVFIELGKWDFDVTVNAVKFTGFRSPADPTHGVIWPLLLKGGIGEWGVTVEGAYNGDSGANATTFARLIPGSFVYFFIVFHKSSGYGWRGLAGKVGNFQTAADHESRKPDSVRVRIEGHGALTGPTFAP